MDSFSSAVVLTDLNDFITPSQACIKPIESVQRDNGVTIHKGEPELEPASITLNDCLACSGCITSAESVLITLQSHNELYKTIKANEEAVMNGKERKVICVTISSQSRASLAAKYKLSKQQIWNKLNYLFKSRMGIDHILDSDFGRDIALIESASEFVTRFNSNKSLPMLASSCPGWICYAEKTHGSVLPLIDTTKSPQQIMGSIVKDFMASKLGLTPSQIYHVSIMPCYDKKLEASRSDFYSDVYSTRDVDLVLSTTELEAILLQEKLEDISSIPDLIEPSQFMKGNGLELIGSDGSSSGGYLSFNLRHAVYTLYGIRLCADDVTYGTNGVSLVPGRNSDFLAVNYTLPGQSNPVLKFAYAYGFRNIQNLVRKLKQSKGKAPYHFVEVMACPSGCINGGGQARSSDLLPSKEWVLDAESVYQSRILSNLSPDDNFAVQKFKEEWFGKDFERRQNLLHTQYHALESKVIGLAVQW